MMIFDGLPTYSAACAFMYDLREQGFECGETHGGVMVFDSSITADKLPSLRAIATKHNANEISGNQTFTEIFAEAIRQEKSS